MSDTDGKLALIAAVDGVKLRRQVVPGDQLLLEASAQRTKSRSAEVRTLARVGGQVVAEANFRFVSSTARRPECVGGSRLAPRTDREWPRSSPTPRASTPELRSPDEVEIGPYCLVGADVRLGKGTRLAGPRPGLRADDSRGRKCSPTIHGHRLGFRGFGSPRPSRPRAIGDRRLQHDLRGRHDRPGRSKGDGITRIGSKNVLMASTHVGRDCSIGDRITLAQGVIVGSSVLIEDDAVLSSGAVIQPFATGRHPEFRRRPVASRSRRPRLTSTLMASGEAPMHPHRRAAPPGCFAGGDLRTSRGLSAALSSEDGASDRLGGSGGSRAPCARGPPPPRLGRRPEFRPTSAGPRSPERRGRWSRRCVMNDQSWLTADL